MKWCARSGGTRLCRVRRCRRGRAPHDAGPTGPRGMERGAPFAAAHSSADRPLFRPATWGENDVRQSGNPTGVGVLMVLISGRLAANAQPDPTPATGPAPGDNAADRSPWDRRGPPCRRRGSPGNADAPIADTRETLPDGAILHGQNTGSPSHAADASHNLIRARGAREQPQRHQPRHSQTSPDGVHRSPGPVGVPWCSARRGRIPTADQRDLQRLRSGFMPTQSRPDADVPMA